MLQILRIVVLKLYKFNQYSLFPFQIRSELKLYSISLIARNNLRLIINFIKIISKVIYLMTYSLIRLYTQNL